jgi:drug/metabolite transporter (DMT)-like permease
MTHRLADYLYIAATIGFTAYGQLILKWRIAQFEPLPADTIGKLKFLLLLLYDPAIFSGFAAAFLASLAWMAAMTKFELSYAYPFMSLTFVAVLVLSASILGEPLSVRKVLGVALIVVGTAVVARS